jgi:site-specific recombinase XerD
MNMKMNELKDKWLNYLIARGRAGGTKTTYDFTATKFIEYITFIGISDISLISTQVIEDFIFGLNVSNNTKAQRMIHLKRFFSYLLSKEYIKTNPTINLDSIKMSQKSPEYLSHEQYTTLIETIKNEKSKPYYIQRDLMIVELLLKTGLRRAEITGLNVADIDMSKLKIKVKRKGNYETEVMIHPKLKEDLVQYLRTINRDLHEPLFMSKRGCRLSPSSIWHLVKSYSRKAGLNKKITVHSLRHTFATSLLSESMPLPYIQKLMGHRSPQTTSRYLHVQDNELSEAFNKVTFGERG